MKKVNRFYWIVTGLMSAFIVLGALMDVIKNPDAVALIKHLGYPEYFVPFIGTMKILGVIAILIPRYPKLKECIKLTNRGDVVVATRSSGCDSSWTEAGAQSKKVREKKMREAGHTLLFALKGQRAAHASLLLRAKTLCSKEYLDLLKDKKYSLALRRAANDLNLELITLILHYKHRITLKLDECSSNGKNALDWAISSKQEDAVKRQKICDLLVSVGIKPTVSPQVSKTV